ncbi:MAG: hypothetical protein NT094_04515, partial [Candidatus Staskawiczbacteria bacterium]|nr:hypothetical protein [Candidatus Staskawiczbacteria bacterium]
MNKSKKFKIVIALAVLSLLLSPVMALAIDESTPPSGGISIGELIANIKYAVWLVFGIVALIMFVIAGILFLTA